MTCKWLVLIAAAMTLVAFTRSMSAGDAPVQVFILAGQSNMEGLGLNKDLPAPLDKPQNDVRIWFDNAKGFVPLSGGFGNQTVWFGAEVTLGRTLKDKMPAQEIVFVKAAYSGANLATAWNPYLSGCYPTLKEKVRLATAALKAQGKKFKIVGMFWVQGESDCYTKETSSAYAKNLESFIGIARRDFDSPDMKFIFTRVHEKLGDPKSHVYGTGGFKFVPETRAAQQAVAKAIKGTAMVSTDDLPLRLSPPNYDNLVHYDTKGFLELGKLLANAYLDQAASKADSRRAPKILPRRDALPGINVAPANLATDKPVTSSPGTQENNVPANAVDGIADNVSGWHASPAPQWLQIDLQKVAKINEVRVYPFYDGSRYYQYTVEISADGKSWKTVADMSKNTTPSTLAGDDHKFDAAPARYVRVTMLKNSANPGVHLNEVAVFEAK